MVAAVTGPWIWGTRAALPNCKPSASKQGADDRARSCRLGKVVVGVDNDNAPASAVLPYV